MPKPNKKAPPNPIIAGVNVIANVVFILALNSSAILKSESTKNRGQTTFILKVFFENDEALV
jgi:hypothetical protein